jgi:NADH-quinone oxidoreductase subunit M
LLLYRRVMFGKMEKPTLEWMPDVTRREFATLAPLLILTILFGIYPAPILDVIGASVENLLKSLPAAAAGLAMK